MIVSVLIGDKVFYELQQIESAFEIDTYNFFVNDFHVAISKYCDGSLCEISDEQHKKIYETYSSLIKPIQEKAHAYDAIVALLNKLSFIFERDKYSYSQIDSFKYRDDVKSIISEAKTLCKELKDND